MTGLVIDRDDLVVGGRTAAGASPAARRSWAWLGLVPFFAFLVLFLIVPAISVFSNALRTEDGFSLSAMGEAFSGQNRSAFWFSIRFSALAAFVGVLFGTLLAYAAATATRPRWLRSLVTSFSGVAANMGGLPLAFAFLTLLGRQGLLTKILNEAFGFDLYGGDFTLGSVRGLVVVYSYFNIPLMVLITLPAIDGLKPSWREACANLGGTPFTYWRRVGIPVLLPSLMGGFLLLFANSFSAYATAAVLTDNSKIVSRRIGFFLGGDVSIGEDAVGYALAAWMIIITAICMVLYWLARKRAERWQG
ncbi:MAG: ABC transporter permease subunit [Ilumatobacteraceae bacterium]|nr:ABC transporter permease subunit [Acidimicrobiales bacterium]MCB9393752.1 ABC transporter permease subunit [Acidimicrobiaceae bacterium]